MSFINGTYKILYIKREDTYFPIGCLTSNSFDESVTMLSTTTRQNIDGWETSVPTNQRYNISFDGVLTQELIKTNLVTFGEIKQLKRNRQRIDWRIEDNFGNIETGEGYFENISDSAEQDTNVTFSGSIIGYGRPIDLAFSIYDQYENRVEINGGMITSKDCQLEFINKILAQ